MCYDAVLGSGALPQVKREHGETSHSIGIGMAGGDANRTFKRGWTLPFSVLSLSIVSGEGGRAVADSFFIFSLPKHLRVFL